MRTLPAGWTFARLNDVADWGSGGTPQAGNPRFYGGTFPWAVIGDLTDGPVSVTARSITVEGLSASSAKLVPAGSILIAMYGSIGKLGINAIEMATNQAIAFALPHAGKLHPRFLFYYLMSQRRALVSGGKGATQQNISQTMLKAWPIAYPELLEQGRIVEILEDHLSRLDAADRQLAMAADRTSRLRGARLNQLIGAQAQHLTPLGGLLSAIEAGRSRGGSAPPAGPDNWGVIKVSAMTWGRFREDENKIVPAAEADPRHEIRTGDLLLSRANTSAYVGASVLVGDTRPKLLLSDKSLRLVPRSDIDPRWLAAVLAAPRTRRQLSALATGTKDSMRNISQPSLRSVLLSEVTAAEQSHLIAEDSAMTESANRFHASLRRGQARSRALRRTLLEAAFSGRLTGSAHDEDVIEELAEA